MKIMMVVKNNQGKLLEVKKEGYDEAEKDYESAKKK